MDKTKIINKVKIWKEFRDFLKEYKVASVAIAFVMGQAINDLVKSFVNNIFMPLLSPLTPDGSWKTAELHIWKISIGWGPFLSSLINFVILAFIIFVVVKKLLEKIPRSQ